MTRHYTFYPQNVCSTRIDLDVTDGCVHNLVYTDGCSGNLQALGVLCEGLPVRMVVEKLSGIRCGMNATSCGDQLARCLQEAEGT